MTSPLLPEDNKQRILLAVLGIAFLGGIGLIWFQFFRGSVPSIFSNSPPLPKEVEINFQVFDDPAFLELGQPAPPIPFPTGVGKQNPFTPS